MKLVTLPVISILSITNHTIYNREGYYGFDYKIYLQSSYARVTLMSRRRWVEYRVGSSHFSHLNYYPELDLIHCTFPGYKK